MARLYGTAGSLSLRKSKAHPKGLYWLFNKTRWEGLTANQTFPKCAVMGRLQSSIGVRPVKGDAHEGVRHGGLD